jgi:formylmethanofuran dehydrogenase subunit D
MTSGSNKTYTSKVLDILENGDAVIELPPELLDEIGWKEGDTLNIEDRDGSIFLSKVTNGENKTD